MATEGSGLRSRLIASRLTINAFIDKCATKDGCSSDKDKAPDTRKHEGKVAIKESNTPSCSYGLELSCDNVERVRMAFALDC